MAMIRPETEMKDSGVEYVGAIPKDWDLVRLRAYFGERKNKNKDGKETNLLSLSYGRIIRKNIDKTDGLLPASFNTYNIVEKNDIIIRPTDLQNDKRSLRTGLVTEHGIITSAYIDLMPTGNVDSRFVHYLLHSYDILKVFYNMGSGVRQGLNYSEFSKLKVPMPLLTEQQAIADYLDETCSEIDEIIAEAKASINEYKELRIAIIDDFTICGLNKTKLKYISKKIGDGLHGTPQYSNNGTVAFINGTNIGNEKITIKSNTNFVSVDEAEKYKNELNSQTILISLNGTIGNSSLYDGENIILGKSAGYITLKNNVCREYVRYCLFNSETKETFDLSLKGTTISNLSLNTLRNTDICLPDFKIQVETAKRIKDKLAEINALIAEKESLIKDLESYKKSLIYEVVTGKRRVV